MNETDFQYGLGLRRGFPKKKISAFSSRSFLVEILLKPNFAGVDIVLLLYVI